MNKFELAKWAVWRAQNDFTYFCSHLITMDEATGKKTPWPDYEYLKVIGERLPLFKVLWVPKSRRMMLTWIMCAYVLWRAMNSEVFHGFIQSLKEEKADDLLQDRVKFLWDNMPYWMKWVWFQENKASFKYCEGKLPNDAKISAVAQGSDQLRQYTPSLVFVDEAAGQPEFEETYTAMMPFVEKATQLFFVSSVEPSFFWETIRDGEINGEIEQIYPGNPDLPPERSLGIKAWNLVHGGNVLQCHYSADPHKDAEWLERMDQDVRGGIESPSWMQEMEIQGDAKSGTLVYPHYVDDLPIVVPPHPVPPESRKWIVGDYGYRNPSAFLWIYEGRDQHYYVYREFYKAGLSIEQIKNALTILSGQERFYQELIDPSTDAVREKDTKTHFHLLNHGNNARNFIKADNSGDGKILIGEWLHDRRLHIFSPCTNLRKEFQNYRHEDWATKGVDKNPKEKVRKHMDHAMDALRYFANTVRWEQLPANEKEEGASMHVIDMILQKLEDEASWIGESSNEDVYTAKQIAGLI